MLRFARKERQGEVVPISQRWSAGLSCFAPPGRTQCRPRNRISAAKAVFCGLIGTSEVVPFPTLSRLGRGRPKTLVYRNPIVLPEIV